MSRPQRLSAPKPQPVPLPPVLDRVLVGAFAALVVARPLVAGDDPGRLRLTSGGGSVSFSLCLLVVLVGFAVWRAAFGRGRPARWAIVPFLLAGVGVAAFASSRLSDWLHDRYARPGLFIAWEWIGLAVAAYLARRLTTSDGDSRGLINVVVASAVSVGGLAVYQVAADRLGLPAADVVVPASSVMLAGDDEFYRAERPARPAEPAGTFDYRKHSCFVLLVFRSRWRARFRRKAVQVGGRITADLGRGRGPAHREPLRGWGRPLVVRGPPGGTRPKDRAGQLRPPRPDVLPRSAWFGLAATTGPSAWDYSWGRCRRPCDARPSSDPDPWMRSSRGAGGSSIWADGRLAPRFVWAVGRCRPSTTDGCSAPGAAIGRTGSGSPLLPCWRQSARGPCSARCPVGVGIVLVYGRVDAPPADDSVPLFVLLAPTALTGRARPAGRGGRNRLGLELIAAAWRSPHP